MAERFDYRIQVRGSANDLSALIREYGLAANAPVTHDYLRVHVDSFDWYSIVGDNGVMGLSLAGHCAYDEAETLAKLFNQFRHHALDVRGQISRGWEPMDV